MGIWWQEYVMSWWLTFVSWDGWSSQTWPAWVQAMTAILAVGWYFIGRWHQAKDLRMGAYEVIGYADALTQDTLQHLSDDNAFLWRVSPEYVKQLEGALGYIDSIPLMSLRSSRLIPKVIAARRVFVEVIKVAQRMHEDVITTPDEMDEAVDLLKRCRHEFSTASESMKTGRFIMRPYVSPPPEETDDPAA